jgi:ribosome-binding protein aMBF1 (putative translation factor)
MIRNEAEYKEAVERLLSEKERLHSHRKSLADQGLKKSQIKAVMDPMLSFHQQLVEEVDCYERLKRGELDELFNLKDIGTLLIKGRIARNLSQRDLAVKLGVSETQVSRDERNEYHGVTLDRAARILKVLGIGLLINPQMERQEDSVLA